MSVTEIHNNRGPQNHWLCHILDQHTVCYEIKKKKIKKTRMYTRHVFLLLHVYPVHVTAFRTVPKFLLASFKINAHESKMKRTHLSMENQQQPRGLMWNWKSYFLNKLQIWQHKIAIFGSGTTTTQPDQHPIYIRVKDSVSTDNSLLFNSDSSQNYVHNPNMGFFQCYLLRLLRIKSKKSWALYCIKHPLQNASACQELQYLTSWLNETRTE